MRALRNLEELRGLCRDLPPADAAAAAAVEARQARLTKPPGSLGRLEALVAWLGVWQARHSPRLERVEALVFAGNHGVVAKGVSAYPPSVTAQMVANFERGGAAINQLCRTAAVGLRVLPIALDRPTADFTAAPAMTEQDFLDAIRLGFDAVSADVDLLCLGEMGIGNTTAAAALAYALFGGDAARWAGRGTGVDDDGLTRKRLAIDEGIARHAALLSDPLQAARALGGRELAAIMGATLAARLARVPVLLDGFACTMAAAPLARIAVDALAHTQVAHVSAEQGHRFACEALNMRPLFDFGMRLGEASGAVLAVLTLRAALACHENMATFEEAGVDGRE